MIWKKLKRLIIPLIILKFVIFLFFIFRSDRISITRDISNITNYQNEFGNDTLALKRQKLIRIVRNADDPGISIKLRGRKNAAIREKERESTLPIVD